MGTSEFNSGGGRGGGGGGMRWTSIPSREEISLHTETGNERRLTWWATKVELYSFTPWSNDFTVSTQHCRAQSCCDVFRYVVGAANRTGARVLCKNVARTSPNAYSLTQHPRMLHKNFTIFNLEPITPNLLQHVATCWPIARSMLRSTVLQ